MIYLVVLMQPVMSIQVFFSHVILSIILLDMELLFVLVMEHGIYLFQCVKVNTEVIQ